MAPAILGRKLDPENEARRIFEHTYPAIHSHLEPQKESTTSRSETIKPGSLTDGGRLRACTIDYDADFAQRDKLIWPEFARSVRFSTRLPAVHYVNNKCYITPT